METLGSALKVFIFGFAGVFCGLFLLMLAINLNALAIKTFLKRIGP